MKVKINMNPKALKELSKAQIEAAAKTAEQMRTEVIMDQVIPMDTGNLQNVATYIETKAAKQGIISIVHDAPYAARLYNHPEYNFDKTLNVNAQGEWWEEWLTGRKKGRPAKLFREFYRRATQ